MKTLVFDIDDTLVLLHPWVIDSLNKHTGLSLTKEQITDFNLTKLYPVTNQEMWDVWTKDKVLENSIWRGNQFYWALAQKRWASTGHKIVFCTARGWHKNAEALTLKQLSMGGIKSNFDLVVVNPGQCKHTALKERGILADLIVDDNHSHALAFKEKGTHSVLVSYPWNYRFDWEHRVSDQNSIIKHVNNWLKLHST